MDTHRIEPTLRDVLRETLDAEHGPHPEWAGSPAARRVAERQGTRWPLRALGAAAAVLVVVIGGYQVLPAGSGSGGTNTTAPPVGPAGNGVIALAKDGDIFVADRPGGDLRPLVTGPENDQSPMFSPDGTRLAFVRETELGSFLVLADADGTNVVQIPGEPAGGSFAPDGRSLVGVAVIDGAKRVVVRPVDPTAAPTVLDVRLPGSSMAHMQSGGPSFNPTNAGEILFLGQRDADGPRGIYVYDLATGGIRTIVDPADDQYVQDVAWLPDGEHITYTLGFEPHVVAADGSGDHVFDALRGRISPFSNDGTRIVAEHGGDGEQAAVVPIDGDGEPVVIACGPGTDIANQREPLPDIECPTDWIWSPDDSMLIGTVFPETWNSGEPVFAETYLQADPATGQVTELDWRDVGTPAWQRVAP